ncbi:hypothetical protein BGZ95_002491 [Linnemannia exigua]|uniref:Uncharacterized protein n=1 Tax=Linnemannia exigua TaxID=604196 RepID=A0AAD4H9I7_9FUNG|nr:hypothetical protein BGZ95_002491 [Linnemannia exigua]
MTALDAVVGIDMKLFVPKIGLAGGYVNIAAGLRMLVNGQSAKASRYLRNGVSLLKSTLSEDQMNYLLTDFLILYICSDPSLACSSTTTGFASSTGIKELQIAFSSFANSVQATPSYLPTSPGYTIPEPAFKNLLMALVKNDREGATAILGQLTPEHNLAIKYAIDTMLISIGVNEQFMAPYGLLATINHLGLALRAAVDNKVEDATKEFDKVFVSQPCIDAFDSILPKAADSLAAYVSKFFDDPILFHDLYNLRHTSPAPVNFQDAANACRAGAVEAQS